jgi:hypothetical protein
VNTIAENVLPIKRAARKSQTFIKFR